MTRLYWLDPEPIEGNNYVVKTVNGEEINTFTEAYEKFCNEDEDAILLITYNEGHSEAQVTSRELIEVEQKFTLWVEMEETLIFPDGEEDYIKMDETVCSIGRFDNFDDAMKKRNELYID